MNSISLLIDGEPVELQIEGDKDSWVVLSGEKSYTVCKIDENLLSVQSENGNHIVAAVYNDGTWYCDVDANQIEIQEPSEDGVAGGAGEHAAEKDKVYAPMPGKIVKLLVSVGDAVSKKQALLIVEAMKMENQVLSLADGKVKAVNCSEGEQVDTETALIELDVSD